MFRRLPPLLLLFLIAGALSSGILPRAQAAPTTALLSGPEAGAFEATADGAFVAFHRSQSFGGATRVYSAPVGGGTPIPLSPAGVPASLVTTSADSQSAVYLVSGNADPAGIYLVPIGGGEPVKLNLPVPAPNLLTLAYASPDRRYVVYHIGPDYTNASAMYSIALDTRTVSRLTPDVPAGESLKPCLITPNSQQFVFWIGTNTMVATYVAPLAGGEPVRLLDPAAPFYINASNVAADSRSLFIQQQRSPNIYTINVVPLDGSPPHELVPGLASNTTVELMGASADSTWAVVKITTNPGMPDFTYTLASVRLDGSGTPVELTNGSAQTGFIYRISISDDGQWVVYTLQLAGSGEYVLYSVPIGGGTPKQLNVPLAQNGPSIDNAIYISPGSRRVVFFGSAAGQGHVYSVPIDGSSTPIQIDSLLAPRGSIEESFVQLTPDGRYVLYRGEGTSANGGFHYDLFATPTDGSGGAHILNDPALFVAGYPYNADHYYPDFGPTADSRHVIFRAGPYQSGFSCSLYAADLGVASGITILRLVRGDAPAGNAGFLLPIDGANFVPGTSVEWNGQLRPATVVNNRRINVSIGAADLAAAGPIAVRAVTPSNDRSNVVYFFVTPAGQPFANTSIYLPLMQR